MRKRIILAGLFIAISITPACGTKVEQTQDPPVPVEVSTITRGNIKKTIDYHGDTKAEFEVRVFSKLPDRIEAYYVDEGDPVRRGEPIARVLDQTIQHGVKQAEAGLAALQIRQNNLKTDFERTKNLYKVKAVSKQQYDSVESQLESLSAQVDQAKAVLATALSQHKDATITSPISGIIGKRFLERGDMAMPSLPVATVVQMDNVKIQFEATETDLAVLEIGQNAEIRVRSCPDQIFRGKLAKISPVLDPLTRMATVEVVIPNPDHLLKPGMFANISVSTETLNNIIVIPRFAAFEKTTLTHANDEERASKNFFVYVINDQSQAEQRQLQVAYVDHMHIAVQSGLSAGETLVVSGQNHLRDGLSVVITSSR